MPSEKTVAAPSGAAATPPGSRSVLVLVTVPETMVGDDRATLERKLRGNADALFSFLAEELHRNLGQPDASPELLLARVSAELRAHDRGAGR